MRSVFQMCFSLGMTRRKANFFADVNGQQSCWRLRNTSQIVSTWIGGMLAAESKLVSDRKAIQNRPLVQIGPRNVLKFVRRPTAKKAESGLDSERTCMSDFYAWLYEKKSG